MKAPLAGRLCRRQCGSQMEFAVTFRRNLGRRLHEQVFGALVHREGDDFANIGLVGKQHDNSIDTRRRPAMRRRAESQMSYW